jgi:hypothetical protein
MKHAIYDADHGPYHEPELILCVSRYVPLKSQVQFKAQSVNFSGVDGRRQDRKSSVIYLTHFCYFSTNFSEMIKTRGPRLFKVNNFLNRT